MKAASRKPDWTNIKEPPQTLNGCFRFTQWDGRTSGNEKKEQRAQRIRFRSVQMQYETRGLYKVFFRYRMLEYRQNYHSLGPKCLTSCAFHIPVTFKHTHCVYYFTAQLVFRPPDHKNHLASFVFPEHPSLSLPVTPLTCFPLFYSSIFSFFFNCLHYSKHTQTHINRTC